MILALINFLLTCCILSFCLEMYDILVSKLGLADVFHHNVKVGLKSCWGLHHDFEIKTWKRGVCVCVHAHACMCMPACLSEFVCVCVCLSLSLPLWYCLFVTARTYIMHIAAVRKCKVLPACMFFLILAI